MTNKEIKLQLARIALERCTFSTRETLTESLKNLYDWITEEPEDKVETNQENQFNRIDIKEVLKIIRKNQRLSSGIATTLETMFNNDNINTVGHLVRIGRRNFSNFRLVGKKSIWAIDDALDELGVKSW